MKRGAIISVGVAIVVTVGIVWFGIESYRTVDSMHAVDTRVSRANELPARLAQDPARVVFPKATEKNSKLEKFLGAVNHQPIEFYGRVLDQNDVPVPNAEVSGQIIYNNGRNGGVENPVATTDANGYFQFVGFSGRTLDFSVKKVGYLYTPKHDAFDYTLIVRNRHRADARNPSIVRMWKLQGPEKMYQGGRHLHIVPNGSPLRFDFQAMKAVETGGDIVIRLKHPQFSEERAETKSFDWKLEIEAVDGGVIEVNEKIDNMLLAPETDYKASLSVEMLTSDPKWTSLAIKNLYLKSRSSHFAKVQIDVQCSAVQPASTVQINWWQNAKGSRNLEYDPNLRVTRP